MVGGTTIDATRFARASGAVIRSFAIVASRPR
jgi:hypothetical protein